MTEVHNNVMSFFCCSWCTAGLDWAATKLLKGHNDPGMLMHTAAAPIHCLLLSKPFTGREQDTAADKANVYWS